MNEEKCHKILLVGDASNHNRALSSGLRRLGHEVTLASEGSGWMATGRDIDLSRPLPGRAGGAALWLRLKWLLQRRLRGYDYVGVISTNSLSLRPQRISRVFDELRRYNTHVFNIALATDPYYIRSCISDDCPLDYNEWRIHGKPTRYFETAQSHIAEWLNPELSALCDKIYAETEGTITDLYEYHRICSRYLPDSKLAYGGIPIEVADIPYADAPDAPRCVRLLLGRHSYRQLEKGTDRLYEAARSVAERYPDRCTLEVVENLPYADYIERLREAHVVLDQIYSYTPATNALLAMAMGKTVVSGGEEEYYDFIGEKELRPIVNAVPDDNERLTAQIEDLVVNPSQLLRRGREGRMLVERHNDSTVVAQRYISFLESLPR